MTLVPMLRETGSAASSSLPPSALYAVASRRRREILKNQMYTLQVRKQEARDQGVCVCACDVHEESARARGEEPVMWRARRWTRTYRNASTVARMMLTMMSTTPVPDSPLPAGPEEAEEQSSPSQPELQKQRLLRTTASNSQMPWPLHRERTPAAFCNKHTGLSTHRHGVRECYA